MMRSPPPQGCTESGRRPLTLTDDSACPGGAELGKLMDKKAPPTLRQMGPLSLRLRDSAGEVEV